MLLVSGSLLIFSRLGLDSTWWDLFPALIIGGIGMALTMTPTTAAAMGSVEGDKAGVGSAVLNSMRQVGGSLGIAIMGAIVASSLHVAPAIHALRRVRQRLPARARGRRRNRLVAPASLIAIATMRQYRHTEASRSAGYEHAD